MSSPAAPRRQDGREEEVEEGGVRKVTGSVDFFFSSFLSFLFLPRHLICIEAARRKCNAAAAAAETQLLRCLLAYLR